MKNLYNKENNIFQSLIWAEFQKAVGREPIEIDGVYFYKEKLVRDKCFLFCPKGSASEFPISNYQLPMKDVVFVRMEPGLDSPPERASARAGRCGENDKDGKGFTPVTKYSILSQQYSPKQTLVLDLTKNEEEILANMKSKHRYNLRLAEKKGVKIRQDIGKKDVDDFYKLSLEVSDRDTSYSPHPKSYYEKMVKMIGEKGNLQIFTAEYEGKPLSSLIILFYNDTAIYLHGASSTEGREVMPNHLAQWEAIKEAKKRGCKYYDFWGAALRNEKVKTKNEKSNVILNKVKDLRDSSSQVPQNDNNWTVDENHSWVGITKFKLGFVKIGVTGEVVEFPGAYDLPIDKLWYNGLGWLNRIRKVLKKYYISSTF